MAKVTTDTVKTAASKTAKTATATTKKVTAKATTAKKAVTKKATAAKKTTTAKAKTAAKRTTATAKKATAKTVSAVKRTSAAAKKATTAKAKTEMNMATANIDKIVNTAKELNKELTNTATEIIEDVRENSMEIKEVAMKTVKEVADKFDLEENIQKIKTTAQNLNKKASKVANEVVADVYANGEQLAEDAIDKVKTAINEFSIAGSVDKVKEMAKNANDNAAEIAEGLVESALKNGEKWQKIGDKAVKGGLKLAAKQQDLVFNNLEEVKDQTVKSVTRFARLFK